MKPEYTWLTTGKCPSRNYIDIMAAPITEPSVFLQEIQKITRLSHVTLCIGGELKTSEEGKPASNFRYEKDETLNKNVIENYLQLFRLHKEIYNWPVFVTTIPRSWRIYSWLIQDDGKIIRKDQEYRKNMAKPEVRGSMVAPSNETAQDKLDEDLIHFLSANCVEIYHLTKIRECCKGARYHTYLADMISFLYQLRINDNFSTSKPCITVRPTNYKTTGRINEILGIAMQPLARENRFNDFFHDRFSEVGGRNLGRVLCGQHHCVNRNRFVVIVAKGQLCFSVWAQPA